MHSNRTLADPAISGVSPDLFLLAVQKPVRRRQVATLVAVPSGWRTNLRELVPTGSFIPKCRRFPFLVRCISGSRALLPFPVDDGALLQQASRRPGDPDLPNGRCAGSLRLQNGCHSACAASPAADAAVAPCHRPSHASAQCGPPVAPPDAQCRARISSCIQSFPGESSLRICSCDEGRTTGSVPLRQPQSCRRFGTRRERSGRLAGSAQVTDDGTRELFPCAVPFVVAASRESGSPPVRIRQSPGRRPRPLCKQFAASLPLGELPPHEDSDTD